MISRIANYFSFSLLSRTIRIKQKGMTDTTKRAAADESAVDHAQHAFGSQNGSRLGSPESADKILGKRLHAAISEHDGA